MNLILFAFVVLIVVVLRLVMRRRNATSIIQQLILEEDNESILLMPDQEEKSLRATWMLALLCVVVVALLLRSLGIILLCSGFLLLCSNMKQSPASIKEAAIAQTLPLFLEQLVMAVQSGLDIPAAIGVILEFRKDKRDECTDVFRSIHRGLQAGYTFDEAIQSVQEKTQRSSLAYVCTYLAHAHREGGALSEALRELSTSIQARYEDDQEEWIATLPVKATMPLLIIFLGLLLLFLTPPLLQLLQLLENAI